MKSITTTSTTTSTTQTSRVSGAPANDHQTIRRYEISDQPRIAHICRNVYGGTDVLPRTIQTQLVNNPAATVLVSQPVDSTQPITGVVCAEVRGHSSYLFGLRVDEEARGNGVASQLMAAVTLHSCQQPQVQHVQSTTIPPNTPAVRLFNKLGFSHSRTVDRWPQEHLQSAYEAAVGFVPNREHPDMPVQFAPKQPHMLDHMPGARAIISVAAAGVQPTDWVCCRSLPQLQQAVASIRQQQQQRLGETWGSNDKDGYSPPLDWLPWVFEVFPLQSTWVQERIAAGDIHLLPSAHPPGHAQHNTAYSAVVVLAHSPLNQRLCAGIMAVDEAGVAAALQFVGSQVPHWVSYIDSGSRHSSGAVDPQLMLAPVLDLGRQGLPAGKDYMCYLVYSRTADARGLPEVAGLSSRL